MQERFHHNEDWYMIEGEQMEATTRQQFSQNVRNTISDSFKEEFFDWKKEKAEFMAGKSEYFKAKFSALKSELKKPSTLLDIFQDVYKILTGMLLDKNITDLKESKLEDEKNARNSITVITTTR